MLLIVVLDLVGRSIAWFCIVTIKIVKIFTAIFLDSKPDLKRRLFSSSAIVS